MEWKASEGNGLQSGGAGISGSLHHGAHVCFILCLCLHSFDVIEYGFDVDAVDGFCESRPVCTGESGF